MEIKIDILLFCRLKYLKFKDYFYALQIFRAREYNVFLTKLIHNYFKIASKVNFKFTFTFKTNRNKNINEYI